MSGVLVASLFTAGVGVVVGVVTGRGTLGVGVMSILETYLLWRYK